VEQAVLFFSFTPEFLNPFLTTTVSIMGGPFFRSIY
jgi:hypothetical protein